MTTRKIKEVKAGEVIVVGGLRQYSGVPLRVTHIRKSRRYRGFYQVQFKRVSRDPGEFAEQTDLRHDEDVAVVESPSGKRRSAPQRPVARRPAPGTHRAPKRRPTGRVGARGGLVEGRLGVLVADVNRLVRK